MTNGGATTLAGYDYTYDAASRITSIDSTVEGLSTFTYDVTNQLTAADHTSQPDETYSFDLNGNRTMTGHTVIANNRLSTDGTYNYEYDNEGNQTKRTKISDGSYEENTWDHRNRLTKVTFKTAAGAVTKTVEYAYDVFTRLVRRTADADGPGGAAATDQFFAFDGYEPVLQFDGTAASDLSNRNLFGPAVDQILAVEDVTSLISAGNVLWGLADHLGTPRDVADLNEGTGVTTVTNHRTYNSFGTQVSETNAAVDFLFGETGKILDDLTGANIHLFRWTRGGQWLSEDPIGFDAGDANLRREMGNNLVNRVDSDGLLDKSVGYPNPSGTKPDSPPVTGRSGTTPGTGSSSALGQGMMAGGIAEGLRQWEAEQKQIAADRERRKRQAKDAIRSLVKQYGEKGELSPAHEREILDHLDNYIGMACDGTTMDRGKALIALYRAYQQGQVSDDEMPGLIRIATGPGLRPWYLGREAEINRRLAAKGVPAPPPSNNRTSAPSQPTGDGSGGIKNPPHAPPSAPEPPEGPYRGGRHGSTKKPVGDNLVSHHTPADSVNGLPTDKGPAIQMEKDDHVKTASHGSQGLAGARFRARQKELIEKGRFGEALQMDIDDIRSKFGNKYDQAICEMLMSLDDWMRVGLTEAMP